MVMVEELVAVVRSASDAVMDVCPADAGACGSANELFVTRAGEDAERIIFNGLAQMDDRERPRYGKPDAFSGCSRRPP